MATLFMKNSSAATKAKTSPGGTQRAVALSVIGVFAVIALAMFLFKVTDHTRELRMAIASRDNVRLESLLTAHPGLVEAKIPNRGPKDTWEPLHMAACFGSTEAIEILTKHKAKVNAKDANGLTPLHYTVSMGRYESAQMLINKGADMNAKGRDGRTPFDLAKNLRDKRMTDMFRVRGAKE
jgi:ankyrin repeat protein